MNSPLQPLRLRTRADARSLALLVLLDVDQQDGFVQELLDRHLSVGPGADLSPPDRRLATHLVYTCLRRRETLQALLQPLVTRDPDQVEPWLWAVLHLGTCQLLFVRNIPPHAALHETVELAARFGRPRAKGFLNGILRTLASHLTSEEAPTAGPDAVPLEGGRYRRFNCPVLPDPAVQPIEYLAQGFGLPYWLVQRWLNRLGEQECRRLGFWFLGAAPLSLRINPLQISREQMLACLSEVGVQAEPGEHPQAVILREHLPVRDLPGFFDGWCSVQDESSMRVASALAPQPSWRVLDLCAAPGGKTTHLAELMGDRGAVVATDQDVIRLGAVGESARRLKLQCVQTAFLNQGEPPQELFDAVLVDVPCSNTGVLGRRPEVRWRLRPADLRDLVDIQTKLLERALSRLKPGGLAVYSTCSIEPEENQDLIRRVLTNQSHRTSRTSRTRTNQADAEFILEDEETAIPGQPSDGGYWARIRKRS